MVPADDPAELLTWTRAAPAPSMRVVLADDWILLPESVARLLSDAKFEHRITHEATRLYGYLLDHVKVLWYEAPSEVELERPVHPAERREDPARLLRGTTHRDS